MRKPLLSGAFIAALFAMGCGHSDDTGPMPPTEAAQHDDTMTSWDCDHLPPGAGPECEEYCSSSCFDWTWWGHIGAELGELGTMIGGAEGAGTLGGNCAAQLYNVWYESTEIKEELGSPDATALQTVNGIVSAMCANLSSTMSCMEALGPEVAGPIAAIQAACAAGNIGAAAISCVSNMYYCGQAVQAAQPQPSPTRACDMAIDGHPSIEQIRSYCLQHTPGTDTPPPWPVNTQDMFNQCVKAWDTNCNYPPEPATYENCYTKIKMLQLTCPSGEFAYYKPAEYWPVVQDPSSGAWSAATDAPFGKCCKNTYSGMSCESVQTQLTGDVKDYPVACSGGGADGGAGHY